MSALRTQQAQADRLSARREQRALRGRAAGATLMGHANGASYGHADRACCAPPASRSRLIARTRRRPIDPSARAASGGAPRAARPPRGQCPGARRESVEPRWPLAARPSLVGRSSPWLADDVRRCATDYPAAGARGGRLSAHPCERAFWHASGECHIATPPRMPTLPGTGGESVSSSRGVLRRAKREEGAFGR